MRHRNKKGVLNNLEGLVGALGAFAILAGIVFLILASVNDTVLDVRPCGDTTHVYNATAGYCHAAGTPATQTGWSDAYNATTTTQSATADIPGWLPIVVITLIGVVLLGLVALFRRK